MSSTWRWPHPSWWQILSVDFKPSHWTIDFGYCKLPHKYKGCQIYSVHYLKLKLYKILFTNLMGHKVKENCMRLVFEVKFWFWKLGQEYLTTIKVIVFFSNPVLFLDFPPYEMHSTTMEQSVVETWNIPGGNGWNIKFMGISALKIHSLLHYFA